jgi:energy-coupling factor transport system permease protein
MSEFEFLPALAWGGRTHNRSALHRLHPGAKLASSIILICGVVAARGQGGLLLMLIFVSTLVLGWRLDARRVASSLGAASPLVLFVVILQILAIPRHDAGTIFLDLRFARITTGDFLAAGSTVLRFADLIVILGVTSQTMNGRELAAAVRGLGRPLLWLGVNTDTLALTLTLTLRFVPIMALEAERLAKAQASRGMTFVTKGVRGGPIARTRRMFPLLVPLFLGALDRAERLALAMQARGYGTRVQRTSLRKQAVRFVDLAAPVVSLVLAAAAVLLRVI